MSTTTSGTTSTRMEELELRLRVQEFLDLEADLADRHAFDDWLDLWTPDGIYWVPSNLDDYDPNRHVSIIYDDVERMQERCFRLSAEGVHSQDPRSRLCRVISGVSIDEATDDRVSVRAKMVLVEVRAGEKNVYGAYVDYELVVVDDGFKLRRKKVMLLDNNEPLGNLTYLI